MHLTAMHMLTESYGTGYLPTTYDDCTAEACEQIRKAGRIPKMPTDTPQIGSGLSA